MERQVWQPYKNQEVMVFGVAVDEPTGVVQDFVNEFKLTYPVLLGNQNLKNQYEIAGSHVSPFPRDYIIGRDGKIAYASDEYDPEAMLAVIRKELGITAVKELPNVGLPQGFELSVNYPNPFNPQTHIDYGLAQSSRVVIQIYDLGGHLVQTLVDKDQAAGRYSATWNGRTANGQTVASGVYLIHMKAGAFHATRRISLVK
jgi:hypothetical protein